MRRHNVPSGAIGARLTARRFTAGFLLGALLLSSTSALADARTEARTHFKKGMSAISDGKYEEGISELNRAYEILPHPSVLYNIARAYAEEGDLENSITFYRKYLDGNPPDKEEVSQIVTALESRRERQQAIAAAAQVHEQTPTPGATPGTTTPGTTPGTATPGTTPAGPVAVGPTPDQGQQNKINVGAAKSEDVFEESVVSTVKGAGQQSPLDAPNSTSIVTEQDIRLSGITKIPELLRRLAGVDILEDNNSQTEVSLRGFNQRLSNKVLVLVDGRSVFIDLIGATIWGFVPVAVEDIERIEVVRGPGSSLYGADAFNGVINIITKKPGDGKSGFSGAYGDHNQAHGTIWASGREKEFAWRMSGGYDYLPRWSREISSSRVDVQTAGDGFINQDTSQKTARLNLNMTRELGDGVTVGLGGGYVNGGVEMGGYSPLDDQLLQADVTDVTAFLTSKHFDVHAFWNSFNGRNTENTSYIGQTLNPSHFDVNVADLQIQYIDDRQISPTVNNNLHVGFGYRFKSVEWTYQDVTRTENFEALYVHDELKVRNFAFVGDIRGDYDPYLQKIVVSPKGSILFHPSDKSVIRGIVATAFRVPTFMQAYLDIPFQLPGTSGALLSRGTSPDLGPNYKLNPENVFTEELGYLNQDSDYFVFDSAIFHNYVHNLIDLAPSRPITVGTLVNPAAGAQADPASGLLPLFVGGWENQCQAYNVYGGEFGIRTFPTEGLDLYANYTLMDVVEDSSGCSATQLSLLTPDSRTSAQKLNAGVQVRTKLNIDGSVDFSYVSPQDWAEQVENVQLQRVNDQTLHINAYTLLNARIGYRFLQNRAEVSGIAFNLLNDQHREHPFGQVIGQRFMGMVTYRF